jgi:predicted nucleic acid-binding protein
VVHQCDLSWNPRIIRVMSRKPAKGRVPATGRVPAIGRKPIGFVEDGKVHAVLDTNVPINAIWALSKGDAAPQTEKDSLAIIEAVKNGRITIALNGELYREYQDKAKQHLATGEIRPGDVAYVINILNDDNNHVSVRVRVEPQRFSRDPDDDMLFDGLAADYLVSDNLKDVKPERLLPGVISPHTKTLSPSDFVELLKTQ